MINDGDVVIVGAVRTPFGRYGGSLRDIDYYDLGAIPMCEVLHRAKVSPDVVGEVLVGINLLREGLDLPEVALVAILDADKEGFLRSETTLIQTMGRASRHSEGKVILYADKITKSMAAAMEEVERRKKIQEDYNRKHGITPSAIIKEIRDWPFSSKKKETSLEFQAIQDIKLLEKEMKMAARNLDFERAAEIRDFIKKSKKVDSL